MKRSAKSTPTSPHSIPPMATGYCTNPAAKAVLLAAGLDQYRVYMRGDGDENFYWAVAADHDRGQPLYIAEPLTIFGESRKDIFAHTKILARRRIDLRDVRDLGLTVPEMEEEAFKSLAAKNGMRDKRTAKKRGRMGGNAKREAAIATRATIAADWVLQNIVREFGANKAAELVDNKISASTFLRLYAGKR